MDTIRDFVNIAIDSGMGHVRMQQRHKQHSIS